MLRASVFFISLLLSLSAWGQRFQPVSQPIGLAEKIVVRGFKGVLQIVPSDTETLTVEAEKKGGGSGWTYEVRQRQNTVEVRVKGPVEQEAWEKLRGKGKVPTFEMKITAPQRPMEIFWNEGQVFAENWGSNLSLQMTKGKTKFSKGQGNLRIQLIDGQIEVEEQTGNIALQTYKGQVLLTKNKGALSLNNHSALYTLKGHDGPIEYRNHSGTTNLTSITGNVIINNVSGAVRIRDFEGSLQADFKKGSLDAGMKSLQNLNITSDEAAITIDTPKASGAIVQLRSEKGRLWAPIHLRKLKKGRWTERKGRLKGDEQGNIKIVSKYGDIVLK